MDRVKEVLLGTVVVLMTLTLLVLFGRLFISELVRLLLWHRY